MNFSDGFIKIMNALAEQFGVAIDWSSKNIVPYLENLLERFVKYETLTSSAIIVGCILLIVASIFIIKWAIKHEFEEYTIPGLIVVMVIWLGSFVAVPINIFNIIEVNTIPEKAVIKIINKNID